MSQKVTAPRVAVAEPTSDPGEAGAAGIRSSLTASTGVSAAAQDAALQPSTVASCCAAPVSGSNRKWLAAPAALGGARLELMSPSMREGTSRKPRAQRVEAVLPGPFVWGRGGPSLPPLPP